MAQPAIWVKMASQLRIENLENFDVCLRIKHGVLCKVGIFRCRQSTHAVLRPPGHQRSIAKAKWLPAHILVLHAEIYPSVRDPLPDEIKDRGQVRAMWYWARDFDRDNLLWREFVDRSKWRLDRRRTWQSSLPKAGFWAANAFPNVAWPSVGSVQRGRSPKLWRLSHRQALFRSPGRSSEHLCRWCTSRANKRHPRS
jgi:hypothetical protein